MHTLHSDPASSGTDRRSGFHLDVAGEILSSTSSPGTAGRVGLAQYQTPFAWANWFHSLFPRRPCSVFDPQCAGGNLLSSVERFVGTYGWEIDPRFFRPDPNRRHQAVQGNCVRLWGLLDELFSEVRFDCQVANPPFSIPWALPDGGSEDSTLYTWKQIQSRAAADGMGFFIANASTIERLGLHQDPSVYLYQRFPDGLFPEACVEIGVLHWWRRRAPGGVADASFPSLALQYRSLDMGEHAAEIRRFVAEIRQRQIHPLRNPDATGSSRARLDEVFYNLQRIMREERESRPPFNIYMRDDKLRTWLSTHLIVRRGLTEAMVRRIARLEGQHPLALAPEAETRRILRDVIEAGFYTIAPDADAAIRDALRQVDRIAVPIMPVTSFESAAYADEMDDLQVRDDYRPKDSRLRFTPGRRYPVRSGAYRFDEKFSRTSLAFSEETQSTTTVTNVFSLSGEDRYLEVTDDFQVTHRFMDRPSTAPSGRWLEHPEHLLWDVFVQPVTPTIAESLPDQIAENLAKLAVIERTIIA